MHLKSTISGTELRTRIRRLGITYAEAADRLGLSLGGLNKQMRGESRVTPRTEIILAGIERDLRKKRAAQ
jgi:hypothetical protein